MKTSTAIKFLIGVILTFILISFGVLYSSEGSANSKLAFDLQRPYFVGIASAEGHLATLSYIGERLDEEAGIAAYIQTPDAITLSQVRGQFRTIEIETADYIIGSVPVPNYIEHYDAHVYVHKDGWIVAYYLRNDPTSKIVDVKARTLNTTKLKTVVGVVASAAGAPFTDVAYYDFRYPNATNMMLVAEDEDNGNDFTIELPSSFGYFERGWAHWPGPQNTGNYFRVDGVNKIGSATYCGDNTCYGILTVSELLPDITHTIAVHSVINSAYGVLVVTYRVP